MRLLPEILTLAVAQLYLSAPWLRPESHYHDLGPSVLDQLKPLSSVTSARGPRAPAGAGTARGRRPAPPLLLGIAGVAAAVGLSRVALLVRGSSAPRAPAARGSRLTNFRAGDALMRVTIKKPGQSAELAEPAESAASSSGRARVSQSSQLKAGDAVQVSIDCGDEGGVEWASSTVRSVDPATGEFTVWITEWDSLDQDDPRYEAAYEEGPFSFEDEFEEWRRAGYDYDREALAAKGVVNAANTFSRFGLDKEDKERWPPLAQAVEELYRSMAASPAPQISDDQRLLGDWELIAATSDALAKRGGLTGLGVAPFTKPAGLYVTFRPDGLCVTKEVLQVTQSDTYDPGCGVGVVGWYQQTWIGSFSAVLKLNLSNEYTKYIYM